MASPVWRVEFDRAADRDLRKLGTQAERLITRYLRERIATARPATLRPCADWQPEGAMALPRWGLSSRCFNRRRPLCGAGGDDRASAGGLSVSSPPEARRDWPGKWPKGARKKIGLVRFLVPGR